MKLDFKLGTYSKLLFQVMLDGLIEIFIKAKGLLQII